MVRKACPLVPVSLQGPGLANPSASLPAFCLLRDKERGIGPFRVPAGAAWLFMNKQGRLAAWEPCTGLWIGWAVPTGHVSCA